jgi:DNA-3-methyladenine glycosylase II
MLDLSEEELRGVGLSRGKVAYVKDLARNVVEGKLTLHKLEEQTDEEIILGLTAVKGIGRWTAEMFLIFSLGRPDVFSCGDLGLKRALCWLYKREEASAAFLKECASRWSPNGTVASLYLWEAINRGYVDEYSSADKLFK